MAQNHGQLLKMFGWNKKGYDLILVSEIFLLIIIAWQITFSVVNINSNLENTIWNCGELKVESWIGKYIKLVISW